MRWELAMQCSYSMGGVGGAQRERWKRRDSEVGDFLCLFSFFFSLVSFALVFYSFCIWLWFGGIFASAAHCHY
jgi:nitrate reductase NapE component